MSNRKNLILEPKQTSGIYITDLTKEPTSQMISKIMYELMNIRGELSDIKHIDIFNEERLGDIISLLSISHRELNAFNEHRIKVEICEADKIHGKSIHFKSRGIGMDVCPGCFVCGGEECMMTNVSAFVETKEDGEKIVSWFKQGAKLDYRDFEPSWIQVKIGACEKHLRNLEEISCPNGLHNVIRKNDVKRCEEMEFQNEI